MNWYKKTANIELKFVSHEDGYGMVKVTFDINGKSYDYMLDADVANKVADVSRYKPGTALDIAKKNNIPQQDNEKLINELQQEIDTLNNRIEQLNQMALGDDSLIYDELSNVEKEVGELERIRDYNLRSLNNLLKNQSSGSS